ncbi:unnamed protein product [Mytilus edulis]|uniref:Uncharacterized protein n=1 Tax=Mytilus edulis TaxID=6550 RepID=A0A8S3TL99_MYTED|nr:unnamed protein product [Mytilus edulis]
MELFLDDNFNRFIPSHKVQELILNTMPVPSYEGFTIRSIDPLIFSIMEEQSRSTNTQLDKAFVSIQTKLIDTMGPLGNLWMLFEDIRSKIDKGCDDPSAQAHVDNVDFRHILDLLEKTICLVGQSNVAINYQRRLSILQRINNQDSKKARSLLRDKQEYDWERELISSYQQESTHESDDDDVSGQSEQEPEQKMTLEETLAEIRRIHASTSATSILSTTQAMITDLEALIVKKKCQKKQCAIDSFLV